MQKNYLLVILIFFLGVNVYSQQNCTPSLVVTKSQERIDYANYGFVLFQSTNLDLVFSDLLEEGSSEFDTQIFDICTNLTMNFKDKYKGDFISKLSSFETVFDVDEVHEEGVNYLIELKYDSSKGKKNKRVLFSDGHRDYYQYIPLSADTLSRGRLAETYQKYGSVLVGTHTVYKYQKTESGVVERVVNRSVNYDELYPVCWSTAIKMARRKGIKSKYPELIAPVGDPNKVLGNGEVYWVVKDGINEVKVDAYGGGMR